MGKGDTGFTRVDTDSSNTSPITVLVADDSEAEREAARIALEAGGYRVVEAIDGQQALEVFTRERPELVMLDVVMPRLTGLETCRILKAKTHANYLPVIMLSTRNSVNARVEGLRSGADDYLGKPYDPEELRARVEALLRTRQRLVDHEDSDISRTSMLVADTTPRKRHDDSKGLSDAFRHRMQEEFDRAERYSDPLACLRVELDDHDQVTSDAAADRDLVKELRQSIESSIRKIDLVQRFDERGYILLLPNTHFPGALAVAERIAREGHTLGRSARVNLSLSIGVSFFPNKDTHTLGDMLELVEAALSRAKSEGGGKICLFQYQGYLYAPGL